MSRTTAKSNYSCSFPESLKTSLGVDKVGDLKEGRVSAYLRVGLFYY